MVPEHNMASFEVVAESSCTTWSSLTSPRVTVHSRGRGLRWIGWKLRNRSAISARVRGGEVHLCSVVALDSVSAPHVCGVLLAHFKDVPLVGEAVDGGLADTGLNQNV